MTNKKLHKVRVIYRKIKILIWTFFRLTPDFPGLFSGDSLRKVLPRIARKRKSDVAFIFGNGPSLENDLKVFRSHLKNSDIFCVNNFVSAKEYQETRPGFYFLIDPGYYDLGRDCSNIFNKINDSTSWDMTVFILPDGKKHSAQKIINKLIEVVAYRPIDVFGLNEKIALKLMSLGVGTPSGINVLLHATFLAMKMGYKKVIVLGADFSWYQNLEIDQMSNEVFLVHKHFYGDDRIIYHHNLSIFFKSLYKAFASWDLLSKYATYSGVKLINGSTNSCIDSLERLRPDEHGNVKL